VSGDKPRVNTPSLAAILDDVRAGRVLPVDAQRHILSLTQAATENLGYAQVDHDRLRRRGFPEVVFGQGKTPSQIAGIAGAIAGRGNALLVTRADAEAFEHVAKVVPDARFHPDARIIERRMPGPAGHGVILVVAAGTSDLPVAEEAAVSAEVMHNRVDRLYDVGVSGLHRLLAASDRLRTASVVIVVAGMEAALASVVTGLVAVPVIGVPTSTGYGTSFGGVTALLGMLNACASGLSVVNIDNGFGAAAAASLINHLPAEREGGQAVDMA
jgi:NCAIR mutase (PurE)-related protein